MAWFQQRNSSLLWNFSFKFHVHVLCGCRQKLNDCQLCHFQSGCLVILNNVQLQSTHCPLPPSPMGRGYPSRSLIYNFYLIFHALILHYNANRKASRHGISKLGPVRFRQWRQGFISSNRQDFCFPYNHRTPVHTFLHLYSTTGNVKVYEENVSFCLNLEISIRYGFFSMWFFSTLLWVM